MVEGKRERLLRRSLYQIRQCDPVKNSLIILSSFCHTGWEGQIPFLGQSCSPSSVQATGARDLR